MQLKNISFQCCAAEDQRHKATMRTLHLKRTYGRLVINISIKIVIYLINIQRIRNSISRV